MDVRALEPATQEVRESGLKTLMGTDWYRLHPAVQARFLFEPQPGAPVCYTGIMDKVHCSAAGWLFAQVTRLIGNPLAAHRGRDVPMQVRLIKRPGRSGVFWQRSYGFAGRRPFVVTSAKREDAKGRLCEYVGFGFGMRLKAFARQGALHFISQRYFWQVGGVQISLPHWLSPGRTRVSHTDLGGGRFRFTIAMDHVFLRRTFYQTGVFYRA